MLEINGQMSLISLTKESTKVNTRGTLKGKQGSSSSETVSNFRTHQQLARKISNNKKREM